MFALTKRVDYALIALSHLAKETGQPWAAREISQRFSLPLPLMMKILKTLNHAELVRSTRGVKGGYVLAMPAEQINLEDIITAVEGPVRFVQCAGNDAGSCELVNICPITRPVLKVHEKLKEFLSTVTLAQIAFDTDSRRTRVPLSVQGVGA